MPWAYDIQMRIDSVKYRRAGRARLARAAVLALVGACAAVSFAGCTAMPDSMTGAFADPAKYDLYNCVELRTARRENARRVAELQGLVARADTATGGPVIAEVAYGNDLVSARAAAKLADEAWYHNHCDTQTLPPEKKEEPAAASNTDSKKPGRPH